MLWCIQCGRSCRHVCPSCKAEIGESSIPSTARLASLLVRCDLIAPEAVEDPDGFDGSITLARIYALGRVLFHGEEDLFFKDANAWPHAEERSDDSVQADVGVSE
jgi:hypothetical protein